MKAEGTLGVAFYSSVDCRYNGVFRRSHGAIGYIFLL